MDDTHRIDMIVLYLQQVVWVVRVSRNLLIEDNSCLSKFDIGSL